MDQRCYGKMVNKKTIIKYLILLVAVALMLVGLVGYERETLEESQQTEAGNEEQGTNVKEMAAQLIEIQQRLQEQDPNNNKNTG